MVREYLVYRDGGRWTVSHEEETLGSFMREDDAVSFASRLARLANREGDDAQVLRMAEDQAYVAVSFGRHPLVTRSATGEALRL